MRNFCARAIACTLAISSASACFAQTIAQTAVPPTAPPAASVQYASLQTRSMATALRNHPDSPLHIIYAHGIAAEGDNDSGILRASICAYNNKRFPDHPCIGDGFNYDPQHHDREFADEGPFAPDAPPPSWTYLGTPIWQSIEFPGHADDWKASRPFVDHYVIERKDAGTILLDEINWWPLVLLPKCRNIMVNESYLAGPSAKYLSLCAGIPYKAKNAADVAHFPDHAFISKDRLAELLKKPSPAAKLNRGLKIATMDWGLSDATLAVGPMHELLIDAIQQLLVKSALRADRGKYRRKPGQTTEYIFVSHSLGSYLFFSALNVPVPDAVKALEMPVDINGAPVPARRELVLAYILQHTSQAYFFANQVALLELAALGNPAKSEQGLLNWGDLRKAVSPEPPRIVAWSDPSDLLSWWVPENIPNLAVRNITIKNGIHWLGLFEGPLAAHDNYAKQPSVLRVIFKED